MSRITKIEGDFMGVKFEVKPTPLNIDKIQEQARQMMLDWFREHDEELAKEMEDGDLSFEDLSNEDFSNKLQRLNAWKEDVEFRSKFLKFKAENAMNFKAAISDDTWKSESLELSTIQEAWDFFCGNRTIPQSGLRAR